MNRLEARRLATTGGPVIVDATGHPADDECHGHGVPGGRLPERDESSMFTPFDP
jgi:hypothetical protein